MHTILSYFSCLPESPISHFSFIKIVIIVLLLLVQLCLIRMIMKKKRKKKEKEVGLQSGSDLGGMFGLEAASDLGGMFLISIDDTVKQSGSDLGGMFLSIDDTVKQQIMDALRVRVQGENIIGLCGPDKRVRHSVKTAIRRAERDQLFQKIVTATVTKQPDITKIQTQIGDAIGLNFDNKIDLAKSTFWMCFGNNKRTTTAKKALLLFNKMKELQTVLVVLYDVHGRLDLGEIGIPLGENHNGCKILLTSTSEEVLTEQMKVHKLIQLS